MTETRNVKTATAAPQTETQYTVKVVGGFAADRRRRAGIDVPRDGAYEGPLTEEQLKAIKADNQLLVKELK